MAIGFEKYEYADGAGLDDCLAGCGDKPTSIPSFMLNQNPQLKTIYNAKVAVWDKCIKSCIDSENVKTTTNNTDYQKSLPPVKGEEDKGVLLVSEKKMSTGTIVGIGFGVLVLIAGAVYLHKRSKSKK